MRSTTSARQTTSAAMINMDWRITFMRGQSVIWVLKSLPYAEKEVEMSQLVEPILLRNREDRWIQVVTQIKANRPYGCAISDSSSYCMRDVVEIAAWRDRILAGALVWLHPVKKTVHDVPGRGKHISHIMKDHGAQVISYKGQGQRRGTQFQVVQEQRLAPQGEAGRQIARPSLIEPEPAIGIASSGKEAFRQRDKIRGTIWAFNSDAGGPRKHPTFLMKLVVRGILQEQPAKICLGPEDARSHPTIQRRESAFVGVSRIVARIPDVGERR